MGWFRRAQVAFAGAVFLAGVGVSGEASGQSKMVVIEQPPEARPVKKAAKKRQVRRTKTRSSRRSSSARSKTAVATYPGFRMLPDGSAEVWVHLSKSVTVETRRAEGRVTFVLASTRVRTWNNTHPLVTTHFNTPLSSVRLRRGKRGTTSLILDLREAANVTLTTLPGPRGTSFLRVVIPRARRNYVPAHERVPVAGRRSSSAGRAAAPASGSGSLTKGLKRKKR